MNPLRVQSNKSRKCENEVNIDLLKECAKAHGIEAIIYHVTKDKAFRSSFAAAAYMSTNRSNEMRNISVHLQDLDYFWVKGTAVAECYPVPMLRTMGDLDLVIHVEDRDKVDKVFNELGYTRDLVTKDHEWKYDKNGISIEVHDNLIHPEAVNISKQETFFNDCWRYVDDHCLDWNFHFLFLVSHIRKHFMNKGAGIRQFLDIAFILKSRELDWDWIVEKATEIELIDFLRATLSFCKRCFDVELPIEVADMDEESYLFSADKILRDGVFGFDNEENLAASSVNDYRVSGFWGMLKNAKRQLFPSYWVLRNSAKYKYVDGKPYLMPIVWIYRLFVKMLSMKSSMKKLKNSFATDEQISKREQLYREWGL